MRLIETDTLSNQNISSALEVGSYTADADREMVVRLFADQVAGNGDYTAYLTIQRAGAGSAYRAIPITTAAAASGVTAVALTTVAVPVKSTDVVKVYLTGLAGDTTTVDTIVEWWEADYLRPTTAGRTLDVSATGEADANVVQISGDSTAADNLEAMMDGIVSGSVLQGGETLAFTVSLTTPMTSAQIINGLLYYPDTGVNAGRAYRRVADYSDLTGLLTLDAALGFTTTIGDAFYLLPAHLSVDADSISGSTTAADNVEANIGNLDAAVSTRATPAQVNSEVDTALSDYDPPTHAELVSEINDVQSDIAALSGTTLTLTSVVNGNTVTVYVGDTWEFTLSGLGSLTAYEVVTFIVKQNEYASDDDAILYLRSDTGLARLNKASATAGDGSLTVGSGAITPYVAMSATTGVTFTGGYKWWIKGLDTSASPDEGTTIATGIFEISPAGVRAII